MFDKYTVKWQAHAWSPSKNENKMASLTKMPSRKKIVIKPSSVFLKNVIVNLEFISTAKSATL